MSGELEAAGDAITGGVIARAVEPPHRENAAGADGLTHEYACLNCGAVLVGAFCHTCGQQAHVHRTLSAIGHDILHGVFHFEGKVWRTLPMLAWKPGDLTRRYIHGQRARFVSPLALFLFSVFLMFAVFESVGGPIRASLEIDPSAASRAAPELSTELAKAKTVLGALERQRETAVSQKLPTAALDAQIDDAKGSIVGLSAATGVAHSIATVDWGTGAQIDTGSKAFDNKVRNALKNPKLLLYKLQSSAYKFAWALIPLSLPFIWLIFAWQRQYKLYDHAVFVTYSLSFVMVLLVAMALLATGGVETAWGLLLVPVHMFRQLQQAYRLSIFSALWRTIILQIISASVLLMFAFALLALGLLG